MKIIILGFDRFDSLEWNLCDTFSKMGIQCKILDPYKRFPFGIAPFNFRFRMKTILRMSSGFESFFWSGFSKILKGIKADLIISTLQNLPPEFVGKIKKYTNTPIIQWNPDPLCSYLDGREYLIYGDYDLHIVESIYMYKYLKNVMNIPALHIPEGFNPSIHTPPDIPKEEAEENGPDIVIAGTLYYERALILEQLMNYNLEIFGIYPAWLKSPVLKFHKGKYLTGREKARKFHESKICLNTIHYSTIYSSNCRLFEIAGSGGFQIAEYRDEIPKLFLPDKEIVLYHSIEELKEKVDYYLKKPEKRWKIADAGRKRAIKEHTWKHRILYLLNQLERMGLI